MKILKAILVAIVMLVAVALITALFVKKDYAVEREIVINKPQKEVFDYIKYVKNQDYFSKWNMMDPKMKKSYKGTDAQVGFVYVWESENENLGKGEQEITKIIDGQGLEMKLRFKEPFEAQDDAYLMTEAIDSSSTKVKWGFKGAFSYPMNLMGLMMDMDKEIGGDLATGLTNLKTVLEKNN